MRLFTTLMFKDRDFTENIIYEKLLQDKLPANLGYLYENIVAQTLTAEGNELFYYTFPNEATKHNYEIEKCGSTVVNIDFAMSGIGSGSCGPQLDPKYQVNPESFDYDLHIEL